MGQRLTTTRPKTELELLHDEIKDNEKIKGKEVKDTQKNKRDSLFDELD